MQFGSTIGSISAFEMLKICWLSEISTSATNRFDSGSVREDPPHIGGKQDYLWRAVDQDGEVVDVYLQEGRGESIAAGEGFG